LTTIRSWFERHKRVFQWLIALVALALACNILLGRETELRRLTGFAIWQLAAVSVLVGVNQFIYAFRFLVIIRVVGDVGISYWSWFKIMIVGRFANILLAQSGNVYRAVALKGRYRLPYTDYVNISVFFAWVDALLTFVLAFALIVTFMPGLQLGGINAAAAVGTLVGATAVLPLLAEKILKALRPGKGLPATVHEKLHGVFATMTHHGRDAGLMAGVTLLGLLLFTVSVVLYSILFSGVGCAINLARIALFLAVCKVTSFVVITPGNIGIRELVFGGLGEALGIGMAQGVMVSAVLRVVEYGVVFPLALAFGGTQLLAKSRGAAASKVPDA